MADTSRTIVCPRCGERLPEGYTRCDACGAYIAPGAAPVSTSAGAPAKKREAAGPRRAPARAGIPPWVYLVVGVVAGFAGGYLLRAGVASHPEGGGGDAVAGNASAGGGIGAGAMGGTPASGGQMPPEIIAQLAKYRSALAMDPNDVQANIGMGNLEFDSNHFENAIQYYTKALDKQPDNPDVRVDRAIAYHGTGQDPKAKEEILRVTKEHPEHVNAWLNLGVVCAGMGDKATAIKAWEQYLKLEPSGQHSDAIRQELDQLKKSS